MLVALETSTDTGSVALGTGGEVGGEIVIGMRSRHAESLLPALDYLLSSTRTGRSGIRGVVVGAGPGSFTGVRVAAATARGLAQGLGVALYAFSSLAALAADCAAERPVCALFDARRGEVYGACYEADGNGGLRTLLPPSVLPVSALLERTAAFAPVYVGEGAVRYARELGTKRPVGLPPRASALLRLAAAHGETARVAVVAGWEPEYLRASGAERGIEG